MNPNEVWHCGHTRKCKWKGPQSEIIYVPVGDQSGPLKESRGTCPKCGGTSFYIRDQDGKPIKR